MRKQTDNNFTLGLFFVFLFFCGACESSNSQLGGDVGGRGTCAATRGRAARRVRGLACVTKPVALLGPLDRWPVAVRVTVEVPVATVARAQRALVLPAAAGDADAQWRGRGGWGLRHCDPIFTQPRQ